MDKIEEYIPIFKEKKFWICTALFAVLYYVCSLLSYILAKDIAANIALALTIIPIVAGTVCGRYSSLGMMIGGASFCLTVNTDLPTLLLFTLAVGFSTGASHKCFQAMKRRGSNEYIYDSRSLLSLLISSLLVGTTLFLTISSLAFGNISVIDYKFNVLLFDNMWATLVICSVVLLIFCAKCKKSFVDNAMHEERWRYCLFFLFAIPICLIMFREFIHVGDTITASVCTICMAVIAVFGPVRKIVYDGREFCSLKFKVFASLLALTMILSIILMVMSAVMMHSIGLDDDGSEQYRFQFRGLTVILVFAFFAIGSYFVEKNVTRPFYEIADIVRNDDEDGNNEFRILSDRLDFIADNKRTVGGNEYVLYIGLTKDDGFIQFDTAYAKELVDKICLRYVGGYISSKEAVGGYNGDLCSVSENVLVYRILGATDEQITKILDDVTSELEQESVLVEKNKVSRWYYCGKKKR